MCDCVTLLCSRKVTEHCKPTTMGKKSLIKKNKIKNCQIEQSITRACASLATARTKHMHPVLILCIWYEHADRPAGEAQGQWDWCLSGSHFLQTTGKREPIYSCRGLVLDKRSFSAWFICVNYPHLIDEETRYFKNILLGSSLHG